MAAAASQSEPMLPAAIGKQEAAACAIGQVE